MAGNKTSYGTKWILIVIVLSAALGAGAWISSKTDAEETGYQTAAVVRGDLTQYVTTTGRLNPVTNVLVGSQISGIIAKLHADWNSTVTNGQVVAQIDSSTYRANLLQAESDLSNSVAAAELARINAARSKELSDQQLLPQSDYDAAVAQRHQAEASVLNRRAALVKVRINLDRCTIISPVDGVVISRNVDVGQTVAASLSAPTLFSIANDLSKMQIDTNVGEADIGGIEVGQDVEFIVDAFPDQTFHGQVAQIRYAPVIVQNVVTYNTVIAVSNPDLKLRPGMTANVSVVITQRNQVLKIPIAALRFRPPEVAGAPKAGSAAARRADVRQRAEINPPERELTRTVYTMPAGNNASDFARFTPVSIKVGLSDGISTEVVEGLKEGDVVITGAPFTAASQGARRPSSPFGNQGLHLH